MSINGQKYDVVLKDEKTAVVNGVEYQIQDLDNVVSSQKMDVPSSDLNGGEIVSAGTPGVVTMISVSVGQSVKKGDTLCILEVMKMETKVLAPQDGKVSEILVQKGATVKAGDALIKVA